MCCKQLIAGRVAVDLVINRQDICWCGLLSKPRSRLLLNKQQHACRNGYHQWPLFVYDEYQCRSCDHFGHEQDQSLQREQDQNLQHACAVDKAHESLLGLAACVGAAAASWASGEPN